MIPSSWKKTPYEVARKWGLLKAQENTYRETGQVSRPWNFALSVVAKKHCRVHRGKDRCWFKVHQQSGE